jgi:hypothetical protein
MRYKAMYPQTYYRRNMPHIVLPGATLFITFRLVGSLPAAAVQQLQAELEAALDTISRAIPADE